VVLSVIASSVLFAVYHYWGTEAFAWRSMVFRTAAGAYFAILFLTRGFGVTAGSHAAYDILIVGMRHFATGAT
jgi:membrane protease YdiL (CAAX protease family)